MFSYLVSGPFRQRTKERVVTLQAACHSLHVGSRTSSQNSSSRTRWQTRSYMRECLLVWDFQGVHIGRKFASFLPFVSEPRQHKQRWNPRGLYIGDRNKHDTSSQQFLKSLIQTRNALMSFCNFFASCSFGSITLALALALALPFALAFGLGSSLTSATTVSKASPIAFLAVAEDKLDEAEVFVPALVVSPPWCKDKKFWQRLMARLLINTRNWRSCASCTLCTV